MVLRKRYLIFAVAAFGAGLAARLLAPLHFGVASVLLGGGCAAAAQPKRPLPTLAVLSAAAVPFLLPHPTVALLFVVCWWFVGLVAALPSLKVRQEVATLLALTVFGVLCALPLGSAVLPEGVRSGAAQFLVDGSPLAAALYGVGYDWLRRPLLYDRIPLGAYYPFSEPTPLRTALWFLLAAVPLQVAFLLVRRKRLARGGTGS